MALSPVPESNYDKNRIMKNTVILYIRMFLSMGVSLYTSRIILETLGVDNYGIYNVVAGVIVLFSFLNSSMSTASSRFITMAIGKKKFSLLANTFKAAITTHIILAIFILLLGETLGLWFFENKLVIPVEELWVARILYQLTIATTIISIAMVPYNSLVIAHEHFNVYAYVELVNVFVRLGILYLLVAIPGNKLLIYGLLCFIVSICYSLFYFIYNLINFKESKFAFSKDKKLISEMLSFSGWDLYGNASVVARGQGVNMLLNMFFGPALNAAAGIATNVQSAVGSFSGNMMTAVRPQILKRYSSGDIDSALQLMMSYIRFSFAILLLLSLPLMLKIDYILLLWLKVVPPYTGLLCIFTLIFLIVSNISLAIMSIIHATGKIKRSSIINGSLYLLVVPITYICFLYKFSPVIPFVLNALFVLIGCLLNAYYLSIYQYKFKLIAFYGLLIKLIVVSIVVSIPSYSYSVFVDDTIGSFLLFVFLISIYSVLVFFLCLLNRKERLLLINFVKKWTSSKI